MAAEEDVRRICLSLPGTVEKQYDHLPGFRVRNQLFARIRQAPEALVVWRPAIADKEGLIASEPDKFFQTPHYEGHPAVLVRLEAIEVDELEDLLTDSWLLRAPAGLVKEFEANRCTARARPSRIRAASRPSPPRARSRRVSGD